MRPLGCAGASSGGVDGGDCAAQTAQDRPAGDHVPGSEFVEHARRRVLDFGRNFADHVKVFVVLQDRLLKAASPG